MGTWVLVADGDATAQKLLSQELTNQGYSVVVAEDGTKALATIRRNEVQVAVIDLDVPVLDGLTVVRVVRAEKNPLPIIVLAARSEVRHRVEGLDAGADDFMVKPTSLSELSARLRALLRRPVVSNGVFTVGDVTLSPASRQVWRNGTEIHLSKTEFDLLELFMRNEGIVLTRDIIYDRIWGYDFGPDSKNLAVYVGYLRRKLGSPQTPPLLCTVRGVGYVFRKPSTQPS